MKKTLVIGSTVVDVFIRIPELPRRGVDVNIYSSEYRIGGCAYNFYKTMELFKSPAQLCSPVGFGTFGRMVREQFRKEGLHPFVSLEKENGCCYCLIEPDGERTFLSHHGAEYLFSRSWMKDLDYSQTDSVFICGIDVEEPTGTEIIGFVIEHTGLGIFFAPGPRIVNIDPERMERIFGCRDKDGKGPFLHLSENEARNFTHMSNAEDGARFLAEKTGNTVVITLGRRGCYCLENAGMNGYLVPGYPAEVVDTVGAGDAHFGALVACLKDGLCLEEACRRANKIGAALVGIKGAVLDKLPEFD
ncbi:MAG: PfkB family carbohydrate kinase [Treponema sp.]|nr:PfkB family carbohydrate kinase [Treponema sp.]